MIRTIPTFDARGLLKDPATVVVRQNGLINGTDITNAAITVTLDPARRYRITGRCLAQSAAGAPTAVALDIKEGAALIERVFQDKLAAVGDTVTLFGSALVEGPTAGSHTYKLTLGADAVDTVDIRNDASTLILYVEDVGPAL